MTPGGRGFAVVGMRCREVEEVYLLGMVIYLALVLSVGTLEVLASRPTRGRATLMLSAALAVAPLWPLLLVSTLVMMAWMVAKTP